MGNSETPIVPISEIISRTIDAEQSLASAEMSARWWIDPLINPDCGKIEPPNKYPGLLAYADGINWNPQNLVAARTQWVYWDGTTWVGLMRRDEATNDITKQFGEWTFPAYDANNFSSIAPSTWTVQSGDVTEYGYVLFGKTICMSFCIVTSSFANNGSPTNILRMKIPAGKTVANAYTSNRAAYILDNGILSDAIIVAQNGYTEISIAKTTGNWVDSVNSMSIYGQICFGIA